MYHLFSTTDIRKQMQKVYIYGIFCRAAIIICIFYRKRNILEPIWKDCFFLGLLSAKITSDSCTTFIMFHSFTSYILQEYIQFDHDFFVYWSKEVRHNLNYLVDPRGNKLVVRIGESSVPKNFFCGGYEIASFYKFKDNYYVAVKYLGNRVFDLRIFDIDMTKIQYPALKNPTDVPPQIPLPRFFNCFNIKLSIQHVTLSHQYYSYVTGLQ